MSEAPVDDSWYEKQQTDRMCGAAALAMAFRYFGMEADQAAIWREVARLDEYGRMSAPTHRIAQFAQQQGLDAIVLHARRPKELIARLADSALVAIINQRLLMQTPHRHYSVTAKVTDEAVVLHDPYYGPRRAYSMNEFLELWSSHPENPLAAGDILIALAKRTDPESPLFQCSVCGQQTPRSIACPRCKEALSLAPAIALGCAAVHCLERAWDVVFCTCCDAPIGAVVDSPALTESPAMMEAANMNENLAAKLADYQDMLAQAHASAEDGAARDQLKALADQFSQQQTLLMDELKKAEDRMQAALQKTNENIAKASVKAEEKKAAQAAKKARPPKAKKPKPAMQPIDAELGERLKNKLFEEFGFVAVSAPATAEPDYRHEIEDWAGVTRQDVRSTPASPASKQHAEPSSKPAPPDQSSHTHWDSWMESWGERQ